jgi:superfamily II DNA or RNA helicase
MMSAALRPFQADGIARTLAELTAGKRSVCCVGPTGMGKTVVLAELVRRHAGKGGRTLVIVHRAELLEQTAEKLRAAGLDRVGVVAAGRDVDHGSGVLVATVQTLLARDKMPERITLLILDECHHYAAAEWRKVPEAYPSAYTLGFTATPMRSDGTPLGDIFESMVVFAQVPELIELGYLVPIDVVAPERETEALCADPFDAWQEHAVGRPALVFCSDVAAAQNLDRRMREAGARSAAIWGDMPSTDRAIALAGFKSGDLDVLTSVHVLTEGFDATRAEVCVLARGCDHVGTFLQMVGRVLRPHPGKTKALLVDLRGLVHKHGYPDQLRQFSLTGRAISGDAPTKDCPECGMEWPLAARICDTEMCGCGHVFPRRGVGFDLAPLRRMSAEDRERRCFAHFLDVARSRGWKPGYAVVKFVERFGRKPWALWREHFPKSGAAA